MTGGSYRTECWVCEASIPMSARYCPRCGEVQTHEEESAPEIRADGGQSLNETDRMAFASDFATDIIDGTKTATVRFDGYDDVQVGDTFRAFTATGNAFADIRITRTATVSAVEAHDVLDVVGAEYPSESAGDVIASLNQHYDYTIRPSTTVRVLVFEVVR